MTNTEMQESIVLDLFPDLEPKCQQCGGLIPNARPDSKFCSSACFGASRHKTRNCPKCGKPTMARDRAMCVECWEKYPKKNGWAPDALKVKERRKLLAVFRELPPLPTATKADLDAADLYRKGVGVATIARIQGRSKKATRHALIRAGVYSPEPKYQHTKGIGKYSRVIEAKRRQERKQQKEKELRHRVAACLWELRKGIGIQRTCRVNGWSTAQIWPMIGRNSAYLRFRKTHPFCDEYRRNGTSSGWLSKKYLDESKFQDRIEAILKDGGLSYEREVLSTRSKDRVDFVCGSVAIEAKITARPNDISRGIGQCLHQTTIERRHAWLVLPDDCCIRPDQAELIKRVGIALLTEGGLKKIVASKDPRLSIQCHHPTHPLRKAPALTA